MKIADTLQDFVITRIFDAPRQYVWNAWTQPEHLAHWWGPKISQNRVLRLELRPGGIFHYAMQFQPGHDTFGRFIFGEITAPQRLVFILSFSDATGGIARAPLSATWPLEVHNTLTLVEMGGKTTLTLRARPVKATEEELKTFADTHDSMQEGFGGTFDQLAKHLVKA
jgi:uncharacterized protein YndB with AHSA1/START domain